MHARNTRTGGRAVIGFALFVALAGIVPGLAVEAHRVDRLDVRILTADVPEPPSDRGTFTIEGSAAPYLCDGGTWTSGPARITDLPDGSFLIRLRRKFTCDTGERFTLRLRNIIVPGEGGVPGEGRWRLVNARGFERCPVRGRGEIVAQPPFVGEDYVGVIVFSERRH